MSAAMLSMQEGALGGWGLLGLHGRSMPHARVSHAHSPLLLYCREIACLAVTPSEALMNGNIRFSTECFVPAEVGAPSTDEATS